MNEIIKLGDKIFTEDYTKDNVTTDQYDYAYKKWEKLKQIIEQKRDLEK